MKVARQKKKKKEKKREDENAENPDAQEISPIQTGTKRVFGKN